MEKKSYTQKCSWASDEPKAATGKNQHVFFQVLILAFCIPGTKVSQIFHCEDMFNSDNEHSDVKQLAPAHKLSTNSSVSQFSGVL